jgi:hypothetical protein
MSLAAKQATETIPIVMTVGADPVGTGLVAGLVQRRRSMTGLTLFTPEIEWIKSSRVPCQPTCQWSRLRSSG